MFTTIGIVIGGDIRFTEQPIAFCPSYGLQWFAQPMDEGYLCEKFFREQLSFDSKSQKAERIRTATGWLAALHSRFVALYKP